MKKYETARLGVIIKLRLELRTVVLIVSPHNSISHPKLSFNRKVVPLCEFGSSEIAYPCVNIGYGGYTGKEGSDDSRKVVSVHSQKSIT
jgi:hypothetical protein